MNFSHIERIQNISSMEEDVFDLAIIGGGITGAGIARDAASRGMKVALLEAKDFAIGTSSRSSKLIHGGIRYLENFEFHLVFEALAERSLLFEMAPHLVHPLRFVLPIYESSRVGFWKMAAGMWVYDLLAMLETPQMHEALSSEETKIRLPELGADQLRGSFEYSDAYMDDDRLVIETLRDAQRLGAKLTNYTKVTSVEKDGDYISSLNVEDSVGNKSFSVKAKQIIGSVGPWTDIFGETVVDSWKKKLRPTKGVHITFSRERLPVSRAVVMAVETRIIFVIPRNEMVIVGTTDTDFNNDPYDVSTEKQDVEYILKAVNEYFPNLKLIEEDIIGCYSGVRPLVNDGSESEGKTSREHSIFSEGPNLSFVAGGKYTTYRKISEDSVDFVLKKMSFEEKMSFAPSDTKKPLNPMVTQAEFTKVKLEKESLSKEYNFSLKVIDQLIERHGKEAINILNLMKEEYSLHNELEALWMGEAQFSIDKELCLSLEDFYWRRSPLFLSHKDHGLEYVDVISKVFGKNYQWSEEEKRLKVEQLKKQIKKETHWKKD